MGFTRQKGFYMVLLNQNEETMGYITTTMVVAWTCRSVTFHGFTDCRELVYCLPDVVVLNPGEAECDW
jgi:hypothetical protein